MPKRVVMVVLAIGLGGFLTAGSSYQVHADSTADSQATVSFFGKALNPHDPSLPVTDGGNGTSTVTPSKTPARIVANTTPEQTKVTAKAPAKQTSATTTLPQTGSETMPSWLIALGLAMTLLLSGGVMLARKIWA
ncbi:LPXTG cell wall anchor domain-containing protein [Lacticaseibacillus mingshuiensis]|uniref:LPXTG cell wall anchor domain-containing protein n=1 Tax=Lacticaseibacillus mingshuiensis TaxID=2799574 RepID=UPI001CED0AB9|nr:LPXTG cell wall anchor domain-containing protein [Lacticaseibacillus mingshuiensis]